METAALAAVPRPEQALALSSVRASNFFEADWAPVPPVYTGRALGLCTVMFGRVPFWLSGARFAVPPRALPLSIFLRRRADPAPRIFSPSVRV